MYNSLHVVNLAFRKKNKIRKKKHMKLSSNEKREKVCIIWLKFM